MPPNGVAVETVTTTVRRRPVLLIRRRFADALARLVVSAGGLAAIAGIVAILGFICLEVYPLWEAPTARAVSTFKLVGASGLVAPATEEYRQILGVVSAQGSVRFVSTKDGSLVRELEIPGLTGATIVAGTRSGKDRVLIATSDRRLIGLQQRFDVRRRAGQREIDPQLEQTGIWTLAPEASPPAILGASVPGDTGVAVVYAAPGAAPQLFAVTETRNLFGDAQRSETRRALPLAEGDTPTTVSVTGNGRRAFIGTAMGYVHYWDFADPEAPRRIDVVQASPQSGVAVTSTALLIGDYSLVIGDAVGNVSVWFPVRDAARESGWRLQRVHIFESHPTRVTAIAVSPRDRRFVTADAAGNVWLRHATTEQTLLSLPPAAPPIASVTFAPKADGGVTIGADGEVVHWDVVDPHPEVSWRTLFGKVWYEGYEQPAYVWQSTGGTDDFEPKLSLVPLIIGTMKGTLYALLFAVPIAVLAAVYTSQFSHPAIRNLVKPTVEIMAALPSVVLGFLAGLWLAPLMEGIVPAVLAMLLLIPALLFLAGMGWGQLPIGVRSRLRPGTELVLSMAIIVAAVALCLWANDGIERVVFGGDFRHWLLERAGLRFDQRNALVVGFAMGFAVIPIIFTISEDALSNVPQRLISGSLALGATRWQTAMRVVFPTASPGIFSAVMIGFGRAVGETMIVLMATGNTPVLDWNIFTGMRTLSASIAVEIPEAPHGSTLYRVLFLAALLLFIATFVVNTAAELVRQRLRHRYQRL